VQFTTATHCKFVVHDGCVMRDCGRAAMQMVTALHFSYALPRYTAMRCRTDDSGGSSRRS
jgi:hypothetical protein